MNKYQIFLHPEKGFWIVRRDDQETGSKPYATFGSKLAAETFLRDLENKGETI